MRTIVIGCDNAAVNLKNVLIKFMEQKGIQVENMGCDSVDDLNYYPNVAEKVCKRIIESNYEKHGVLICGTGLGMAMTANKFKGIRAGVCHDNYSAERLKLSNNGNVLCMGERVIGVELAKKILGEWLNLEFAASASSAKIEAIKDIEKRNFK
jgi:ribose 5-phosphate isomerase B